MNINIFILIIMFNIYWHIFAHAHTSTPYSPYKEMYHGTSQYNMADSSCTLVHTFQ